MSSESTSPETKGTKSVWETVLASTPVVLTVLATILAGISNSEMTQAQYHRSLAAQYQSKVGDQWAYFQAKKIRASSMENTTDLMHTTGKIDAAQLKALAHQLTVALERAARDSRKADEAAGASKSAATAELEQRAKNAAEAEKRLADDVTKKENAKALGFVVSGKLPEVEDQSIKDDQVEAALKALEDGDTEINKLALRVQDDPLHNAMTVAQGNGKRFDEIAKPVGKALDQMGVLVTELVALANTSGQEGTAQLTGDDVNGDKEREAASASEERARVAADRLHHSYSAARARYNARRLNQDAKYNLTIAWLHEIQVHKSAAESDRHRERSLHFFIGMLVAQAGVAISSMSLAARRKSVLWGLAGLLGIAAVIFSGYVYLYR